MTLTKLRGCEDVHRCSVTVNFNTGKMTVYVVQFVKMNSVTAIKKHLLQWVSVEELEYIRQVIELSLLVSFSFYTKAEKAKANKVLAIIAQMCSSAKVKIIPA